MKFSLTAILTRVSTELMFGAGFHVGAPDLGFQVEATGFIRGQCFSVAKKRLHNNVWALAPGRFPI